MTDGRLLAAHNQLDEAVKSARRDFLIALIGPLLSFLAFLGVRRERDAVAAEISRQHDETTGAPESETPVESPDVED